MLQTIITLLPAAACLCMLMLLALRRPKCPAQRALVLLLSVTLVLLLTDAFYLAPGFQHGVPDTVSNTIFMLTYPVLPLIAYFVFCHLGHQPVRRYVAAFAVLPMLAAIWQVVLIVRDGFEQTHQLMMPVFYLLMLISCCAVFLVVWHHQLSPSLYTRRPIRDFLRGEAVAPFYIFRAQVDTAFVLIVVTHALGGSWRVEHVLGFAGFSVLFTLLICEMGVLGCFYEAEAIAMKDFVAPLVTDSELTAYRQSIPDDYDASANAVRWFPAIRRLMEDDRLYLQPDVTIEMVASRIGTNAYYVSRAVHRELGLNFRTYVHRLRIDYAKQYMLLHPEAKQDEIADECGYLSSVTFNKNFSALVGMTPREWMLKAPNP